MIDGPWSPKNHRNCVKKITISSAGSVSIVLSAGARMLMINAGNTFPDAASEIFAMATAITAFTIRGISAAKLSHTMEGMLSGSLMMIFFFVRSLVTSTLRIAEMIQVKRPDAPR